MWLSRIASKGFANSKAEKSSVTIAGTSEIETLKGANARSLSSYSPYGYTSCVPTGEEVVVVPASDGEVVLGTRCKASTLDGGEVMIASLGGAKIVLKNNGDVVINSLIIDKNGVIHND